MMILADESEQLSNLGAKIKVVGIGGCGCNAVNTLVKKGITGVELIGVNTDLQSLSQCKAPIKIQAGKNLTKGLGARATPVPRTASPMSRIIVLTSLKSTLITPGFVIMSVIPRVAL